MSVIAEQIAQELNVKTSQINAAINLLDDGATVPFIARYRKEATQGLDDNHLRELATRLTYLRDLEARRQVILTSIKQQDKLSVELAKQIGNADNKTRLEDLYLPYKPKRRTKGQIAIEAGLEPLANSLFNNWQLDPEQEALPYLNKLAKSDAGFDDVKAVLDGASAILAERFSEDANLLQKLRNHILKQAHLTSKVVKGKDKEAAKFRDYFEHSEKLSDQEQSVKLFTRLLTKYPDEFHQVVIQNAVDFAVEHLEIIKRFGRFPHRNKVLNRQSTVQEIEYLKSGHDFGQGSKA